MKLHVNTLGKKSPTSDLFLCLGGVGFLQQLQGLSNAATLLNLLLVRLMLEHQVPQGSGGSLAHCRVGAAQQGHQCGNPP